MRLRFIIFLSLLISFFSSVTFANDRPLTSQFGNVYVMDNNPEDNNVVAYFRSRTGRLINIGNYSTQGLGAGDNAAADPLGGQGAMTLSRNGRNLYVVNAGSDDISIFSLTRLGIPVLIQKVSSNGDFPVSLAVSGRLLYVLNAGSDGSISGFRIDRNGRLSPISNSTRALGLGADTIPVGDARNLAPGDIAFDRLNRRLLITHAGGNNGSGELISFELNDDDTPGEIPALTDSEGAVPFSLDFSNNGAAIIAEASGSLSSYNYDAENQLANVSSVIGNGQAATCWVIATNNNFVYTTNTVSGTISLYSISRNGTLSLVDGEAAQNIGLPIDFDLTRNQRLMYVVSSSEGGVRGYKVNRNTGQLTDLGLFTGLPVFDVDGFAPQGIAVR